MFKVKVKDWPQIKTEKIKYDYWIKFVYYFTYDKISDSDMFYQLFL